MSVEWCVLILERSVLFLWIIVSRVWIEIVQILGRILTDPQVADSGSCLGVELCPCHGVNMFVGWYVLTRKMVLITRRASSFLVFLYAR